MKNRITSAVAVYLILERKVREIFGTEVLIMRRCNTGYQDGMYQVPAGHLEDVELPSEALIREAEEEVGIAIDKKDVELVHVSARPRHEETGNRIDFFYRVRKWSGEPTIMDPMKCDDARWVFRDELPENMTPHVREGIILATKGVFTSEYGLDWIRSHSEYGIK
jgi:ADP-ribose pyrophosphatase YjhB (NUDIX family)